MASMADRGEWKMIKLAELEAKFARAEQEVQAAPDDDPESRDLTGFPEFAGRAQASRYGAVAAQDLPHVVEDQA